MEIENWKWNLKNEIESVNEMKNEKWKMKNEKWKMNTWIVIMNELKWKLRLLENEYYYKTYE